MIYVDNDVNNLHRGDDGVCLCVVRQLVVDRQ